MLYNFGVPRVDFIFNLFVFQMVLWCPMAPRPSIRGKAAGVWGKGEGGGARGGGEAGQGVETEEPEDEAERPARGRGRSSVSGRGSRVLGVVGADTYPHREHNRTTEVEGRGGRTVETARVAAPPPLPQGEEKEGPVRRLGRGSGAG